MKIHKLASLFFICTLFFITSLSTLQITPALVATSSENQLKAASLYPIQIIHNDNFSTYASTGDGSVGDPWIIRDYVITNATVERGINIEDTTDHFVITNCTLTITHPTLSRAISLFKVINGNITGNTIIGSQWGINAIFVNDSLFSHNTFTNISTDALLCASGRANNINHNTFSGNMRGIYLTGAEHEIMYNTIVYSTWSAMALATTSSNVSHNIIHWNMYGLLMDHCFKNKLINNSVKNNGQGIVLENSDENTLYNNIAFNTNDTSGIWLKTSHNNTIINNFMEDNDFAGLRMENSDDNDVYHNQIKNNDWIAGIMLSGASGNNFYNNTLNNPTEYGIELKLDSDSNNITGNIIKGWESECVHVAIGCDYNIIGSNTCTAGGGGIPGFLLVFALLALAMATALLLIFARKDRSLQRYN